MIIRFFILTLGWSLLSCQNRKEQETLPETHKVKSIDFDELKIIEISPQATPDFQNWTHFRTLMQVIVSMAPNQIKNSNHSVSLNPDSLLVYHRFSTSKTKTILESAEIERDWRTVKSVQDTVFRLEKKNESEVSFMQWNHFLVENVPYTFSIFVKDLTVVDFGLNFVHNENVIVQDVWKIRKETDSVLVNLKKEDLKVRTPKLVNEHGIPAEEVKDIDFSTTPILEIKTETVLLDDNWKEFRIPFIPEKSDVYGIRIGFRKDAKQKDLILFYRPTLQIRAKDFYKMGEHSDKIIKEQSSIKSSYYSVFFWLRQIEDELKQLLSNGDTFPEKINTPIIKSRFRLFETQVKELADNVKNNPDFKEEEIKQRIAEMQKTFNAIILHINKLYESDLDNRMQEISSRADSITIDSINASNLLKSNSFRETQN